MVTSFHLMNQIEIILGPTNTGKTFYAFEQMFSFKNGVFGFPLRLLARENYDKACKLYPINQIALITGEEKIIPLNRVGKPTDISNTIMFLLSDQSNYITGTEIIVDGGITAKP